MITFLLLEQNLAFTIALFVLLLIGLIEVFGLFIGFSLMQLVGGSSPDIAFELDTPQPTAFDKALSWLRIGKVPLSIILVLFLASFGFFGLFFQSVFLQTLGFVLPLIFAVPIAFLIALPCIRLGSDAFARLMPGDETHAVSSSSFIGRIAVITTGTAKQGYAAPGKVKDSFQQTHYILIEPDIPTEEFMQGSSVLLVRQAGAIFYAIANEHAGLVESDGDNP